MRLVIIGPSVSDTAAQAESLAIRFSIPQFSADELARMAGREGSSPETTTEEMGKPGAVSDAAMLQMVRRKINRAESRNGFILDGFPATVMQAVVLDQMLSDLGLHLDAVVEVRAGKNDNAVGLALKMNAYRRRALPLTEYYRRTGQLVRVNGSMPVAAISAQIVELVSPM